MNDQILVPNITCIDKDGNIVPVQAFTGGSGFTALESPVTFTFQPVVAQDTAQLEFNFNPTSR